MTTGLVNEIGNRYGKLVVQSMVSEPRDGKYYWLCLCDCGTLKEVAGTSLRRPRATTSCGRGACSLRYIGGRIVVEAKSLQNDKRGHPCSLTQDRILDLFSQNCVYCGTGPERRPNGVVRNGIDRLDSTIGYHEGNVVPCCGGCNRMKGTLTPKQFLDKIRKITETCTI